MKKRDDTQLSLFSDMLPSGKKNNVLDVTQKLKRPTRVVVKNCVKKSQSLYAYSSEEMQGYCGDKPMFIATGIVNKIEKNQFLHIYLRGLKTDECIDFYIQPQDSLYIKASTILVGDRISVLMTGNYCIDIKFGPIFGDLSWKLNSDNNDCAVAEFVVKR